MVETYLAAHRDQIPPEAFQKRIQEWTPQISAQNWKHTLASIAAGKRPNTCIYIAEATGGEIAGLVMGELTNTDNVAPIGDIYILYVRQQYHRAGLGRRLLAAAATELAVYGATGLRIGCLTANTPARRFYEALGGHPIEERLADEDGVLLPEVVYQWADIQALMPQNREAPHVCTAITRNTR